LSARASSRGHWARDLGDDVLEVGPGYGATTDVLRERVAKLTAVEIDPALAAVLADRLAGANVTVVEGDATALDFDDGRFTGATCFAMLHHVPTSELQDQLFAEVARVLRPGATSPNMKVSRRRRERTSRVGCYSQCPQEYGRRRPQIGRPSRRVTLQRSGAHPSRRPSGGSRDDRVRKRRSR
jgi:ubiquinone/menaquinone biosynthesis C-methylase UbiE